jgi:hypothetical protein
LTVICGVHRCSGALAHVPRRPHLPHSTTPRTFAFAWAAQQSSRPIYPSFRCLSSAGCYLRHAIVSASQPPPPPPHAPSALSVLLHPALVSAPAPPVLAPAESSCYGRPCSE